MPFGVLRYAGSFAEINVGRKFQEVRRGIVGNFGHALSEEMSGQERNYENQARLKTALHGSLQIGLALLEVNGVQNLWHLLSSTPHSRSLTAMSPIHRTNWNLRRLLLAWKAMNRYHCLAR